MPTTFPKRRPEPRVLGDHRRRCDNCGADFYRSKLRRDRANLLICDRCNREHRGGWMSYLELQDRIDQSSRELAESADIPRLGEEDFRDP